MRFKIFLDDVRYTDNDWVTIKTCEELISFVDKNSDDIDFISLDNDLGTIKEGRHFCNWLEEEMFKGKKFCFKVGVHSSNTSAVKIMKSILIKLGLFEETTIRMKFIENEVFNDDEDCGKCYYQIIRK